MRVVLKDAVTAAGGLRPFSRQTGVHIGMLSEALNGGLVGPKLLAALGLVRVPTYHRITP